MTTPVMTFVKTDSAKLDLPVTLPTLSPREAAQHGLDSYETNVAMRLINAAFHATIAAAGKLNWRPRHVVVRLVGPAGVGKTAIVESYARNEGIGYVKLDAQVTDIAEVFGLKATRKMSDGSAQTITAMPDWWPKPGTMGILNVDDMSRALPHVLQSLQQFIMEREFNGSRLPDGWAIVITDNPDDSNYHVSSMDAAQLSRMISVPWNPPVSLELEQLAKQDVHDDLQNFWTGNAELLRMKPIELDVQDSSRNPRMRMIFNRIYPYLKFDDALLDFVATSMFGPGFVATLKSFLSSEQPIAPADIFNDVPYSEKLSTWEDKGKLDLISMTVERLLQEMRVRNETGTLGKKDFAKVARFLMTVRIDSGAAMLRQITDTKTSFGNRMVGLLVDHGDVIERYKSYLKHVREQVGLPTN